ncbi:MAG: alpha-hydroxy-acid oxidizing protein [Acidobacteriaceae bacterium]|nr:alpha-hydroxy-acid oxidizing protein [Acidobacteriaceae bacterium]
MEINGKPLLMVHDFEQAARDTLPHNAYEYLEGGVADDLTVRENRTVFDRMHLNPQALVDVSKLDTSLDLFGMKLAFPVLLAPTGYHKLFHPDGELETLRGAEASGAHFMTACFSTVAYEEIASAATRPLSFQLYLQPHREHTKAIVDTVLGAGCAALCVTVDVPVNGPRDRELRSGFGLPEGAERSNLSFLGQSLAHAPHRPAGRDIYSPVRAPNATWSELQWLRSVTPVPLIIKGLLNPEEAEKAIDCGCDGVIVSNHGGRSIDTAPAAITALPRIVQRVRGRVPVLVDGGIRRGTDVFKCLALGAKAVLIGRPYLYGLAVAGAAGVARVVEILRTELEMAMGLMGCARLSDITAARLWQP